MPSHVQPLVYTSTDVATMLATSRKTVELAVAKGHIRTLPRRPGQRIRVPREEVERLVREGLPPVW